MLCNKIFENTISQLFISYHKPTRTKETNNGTHSIHYNHDILLRWMYIIRIDKSFSAMVHSLYIIQQRVNDISLNTRCVCIHTMVIKSKITMAYCLANVLYKLILLSNENNSCIIIDSKYWIGWKVLWHFHVNTNRWSPKKRKFKLCFYVNSIQVIITKRQY